MIMSPFWKEKRHTGEDPESQFKQRCLGFSHSFSCQGAISIKGGHGFFCFDFVCACVFCRSEPSLRHRLDSGNGSTNQAFSAEVKKMDQLQMGQSEQESLVLITEASSKGRLYSGIGLHLIGHLALIF